MTASVETGDIISGDSTPNGSKDSPKRFDGWKYLKGISSSGMAGVACWLVYKGQWKEAVGAFAMAVLLLIIKPIFRFVYGFFKHAETRLDQGADKLSLKAYNELERISYKVWIALFSQYQRTYCNDLVFRLRKYRTQGLQQGGAFALDLEHVYVPLRISPKSIHSISSNMVAGGSPEKTRQIWEFLSDISYDAPKRLALVARPGAGKTTLLEHLALVFSRGTQRRIFPKVPRLLPILFYLRKIRGEITGESPPSLAELLSITLRNRKNTAQDLTPPTGWFEDKLRKKKNPCLVMLDGLDEVADDNEREAVCNWVDKQMQSYPEARFILTSRPQGYLTSPCEHIDVVLEVQPFSMSETICFVQNWFLQNEIKLQGKKDAGVTMEASEKSDALIKEIQRSVELTELSVNPLLLTMITTVMDSQNAVPESRVALYKEICEVLLARRQRAKGLKDGLKLNLIQRQAVLRRLALELMLNGKRESKPEESTQWLTSILYKISGPEISPQIFIEKVARQSGLLVEREQGEYEFSHKSFQEYLAATEIKETKQEDLLVSHFGEPWWEETIRLYAALSDTASFVKAALDDPSVTKLALAYDCVQEGLSTPPELRTRLEEMLDKALDSDQPEEARIAAEVKLLRRLRTMLPIDEGMQLDNALISNAEYQLFVTENPDFAPIHWQNSCFQSGAAKNPVTGIWTEAAQAFCEWLSRRDPFHNRYRLPTSSEIKANPISTANNEDFYYWCEDKNSVHLMEVVPDRLLYLSQSLELPSDILDQIRSDLNEKQYVPTPSDLKRQALSIDIVGPQLWPQLDFSLLLLHTACNHSAFSKPNILLNVITILPQIFDFRASALDLDLALASALASASALDLARALTRASANAHASTRDLARASASTRASALALARALDRDLASDLARDLASALDRDLAFDRALVDNFLIVYSTHPKTIDLWKELQSRDYLSTTYGMIFSLRVLNILLSLSFIYSEYNMKHFENASVNRKNRPTGISKANCQDIAKYYSNRTQTLARLNAWTALYAAREKQKHPGWEGIRIVKKELNSSGYQTDSL